MVGPWSVRGYRDGGIELVGAADKGEDEVLGPDGTEVGAERSGSGGGREDGSPAPPTESPGSGTSGPSGSRLRSVNSGTLACIRKAISYDAMRV